MRVSACMQPRSCLRSKCVESPRMIGCGDGRRGSRSLRVQHSDPSPCRPIDARVHPFHARFMPSHTPLDALAVLQLQTICSPHAD